MRVYMLKRGSKGLTVSAWMGSTKLTLKRSVLRAYCVQA